MTSREQIQMIIKETKVKTEWLSNWHQKKSDVIQSITIHVEDIGTVFLENILVVMIKLTQMSIFFDPAVLFLGTYSLEIFVWMF